MFINNWYVAGIAEDLGESPKQVRILAQDFVLFRNDEGIHCLSNLCIHRGASLAIGQCIEGQIQCPQHGWVFNGKGQCTQQPH